ncbi:MAG: polysulfide reductase NrfD [Proteobacteria bacterium]|nr:polysulfide reductase NrfD [Pseudomonadota bacterium]
MPWIVLIIALLVSMVWGIMFLRQMKTGLTTTALDDKFTWGLYVQGFFYFSALAGGILIFVSVVTLFEVRSLGPLVEIGAAVAFGCLVAAGLLLGSDLGKPFRGMKILSGKNFASPLTWDFYMLSFCAILIILFLLGLVPSEGPLTTLWSLLCLIAALGFVMIHTLFFLSRVGAGFRSQPFLGLDTLAQSLWGGMALINLIAPASGMKPMPMAKLLLVGTVLTLISLMGSQIAYLSNKRKGFDQKKIIGLDTFILVILVLIQVFAPNNGFLLGITSLLILLAVFMEKSHLMRQYQVKPTLPLPYSRYETASEYAPTANEWILTLGSAGVCVFLSVAIIILRVN